MWFTENAWPPVIILLTVAAALVAVWMQSRRTGALVGVLLSLAAAVGVYVAEKQIVTESERVEMKVQSMVDACVQDDKAAVLAMISPQELELRRLVEFALGVVDVEPDARLTDLSVKLTTGKTQAVSRFRVNATIGIIMMHHRGHHPSRWEVVWRKIGQDWKVTEIRRMNVVTGETIEIMDRHE